MDPILAKTATLQRVALSSERTFLFISALLFFACVWLTYRVCAPMGGGMAMPGAWTMPMTWMLMRGQTWPTATFMFLGMWLVMMVAMMLPSLVPMLLNFRRSISPSGHARLGGLTAIAGAAYFLVWTLLGGAAYVFGLVVSAAEMSFPALSRAVPFTASMLVVLLACVQFSSWKARQLARCRSAPAGDGSVLPLARIAWNRGLRMGLRCAACSANLMLLLLVLGVMDLGIMSAAAIAISAERLAPHPVPVARTIGVVIMVAGAVLLARSLRVT